MANRRGKKGARTTRSTPRKVTTASKVLGALAPPPYRRPAATRRPVPLAAGTRAAEARISVSSQRPQRVILLPPRGLRAVNEAAGFLQSLFQVMRTAGGIATAASVPALAAAPAARMRVIDSIAENGAKLVEIAPAALAALRTAQPGLRIVPEVFYAPQSQRLRLESELQLLATGTKTILTVVSSADGKPIQGVHVVAFTDFARRLGAEGVSNTQGVVTLQLPSKPPAFERVYAYADRGFWSGFRKIFKVGAQAQIALDPIDLTVDDCLRHFYKAAPTGDGSGVTVGVIDTGSGPHPDLTIAGGYNAVGGGQPNDFMDNGDLHGTHVAGIIAAKGAPPKGVRGMAPNVVLRSYRVFPKGGNASNFDIAKAIDHAREDRCDLVNLSLGRPAINPGDPEPQDEPLVRVALEDARAAGILPIVAAGNDDRHPVGFPASDDLCIAVSALGRKGTSPKGSVSASSVAPPPGKPDARNFIADFSNVGPQVDVTGPGVGIVSTIPPNDYGVMDGTSMACPAITGVAARLLSSDGQTLKMARDGSRSDAMAKLLLAAAKSLGFPPDLEGRGLPT